MSNSDSAKKMLNGRNGVTKDVRIYIYVYYMMILFKQFYWLSCCHLTFVKFDIV